MRPWVGAIVILLSTFVKLDTIDKNAKILTFGHSMAGRYARISITPYVLTMG